MPATNITSWVRLGLWTLPIYGLLTLASTLTHQPDPSTAFESYARYVSTASYLVNHLLGSIFGMTLGVLGAVALGAYLANGRTGRVALWALASSVVGKCFILTIFGMSTFATPAVGRAFLAGQQSVVEVNQDILGLPLIITALLGGLLYSVGTALFGIAVWRSGTLPKWAGALYAPTGFLISIAGLVVGQAQTVGAVMVIAGTGWIAWSVPKQPASAQTMTATTSPRVQ